MYSGQHTVIGGRGGANFIAPSGEVPQTSPTGGLGALQNLLAGVMGRSNRFTVTPQALIPINSYRAFPHTCGGMRLPAADPLVWDDTLAQLAGRQAAFCVVKGGLTHQGADGTQTTRLHNAGVVYSQMAELLGEDARTAEQMVRIWGRGSKPGDYTSCTALSAQYFNRVGMACARTGSGSLYWVAILVG